MQVQRLHDTAVFLDRARPLLLGDEARHNLLLGLADTLLHHPGLYPAWDLWLVHEGDVVVGAALQTPPYNLVLAQPATDDVLDVLVDAILASGIRVPGVSGVRPEADGFAQRWSARTGDQPHERMAQGVYALRHVRQGAAAPGAPRLATQDDEPSVLRLVQAFAEETALDVMRDPANVRHTVAARMDTSPDRGGFWLWEIDGEVVSISGHGMPTPNGIRIGPVFTVPAHRGRGSATSLVATQAAWLLARGWSFCFLYTDLANPTSNGVYRRVGYEQVAEALDIGFEPGGS